MRIRVHQNQVLFLIDGSDSIGPEQQDSALNAVNQGMKKLTNKDQAGIIVFGSEAVVERFPSTPRPLVQIESRVDGSSSNLENAASLAEALLSSSYQKNIVLVSDGLENSGKADDVFSALRRKGISTQAIYLPPLDRAESGLETILFPDEVTLRQNFSFEVVASSNRNSPAVLQIYRNGVLIQEGTLALEKGKKHVARFPQKIDEPGMYRYEFKLKAAEDFSSENNSREVWISVEGAPRILLADERPEDLNHLAKALTNRGFQVDLKPAAAFPRSLQEMLVYQAIFLRNIPASRIHDQMPQMRQYVKDFGGGFLMIGGAKSFGPGGYYKTPVEEVLPVQMDLINKKYLADVAMVIVIDKSGSMSFASGGRQKIDLADEGGARVASLLKKTDQLGVLAVDSVPKWAFHLQKLVNQEEAIEAITSIRAGGGGIYVYSGLQEAIHGLRQTKATVKHVILFADTADCEEKAGPGGESSNQLADSAFQTDAITVTTIGIGQPGDGDIEFLRELAAVGRGRFYFTDDMFTLPEIFTQESVIVQRNYINEDPFQPIFGETEHLLDGIPAVPELLGYVATSAKRTATVALLSKRDDPVLASWQSGLGYSAAFTSDPTPAWGKLWLEWPDFERFWTQVARFLARHENPAHFRTSFSGTGNHTIIIVEALDPKGSFVTNAEFMSVLIDSSGNTHTVQFEQTAPGRYEAAVEAKGGLFGKIFHMKDGSIEESSVVQFSGLPGREHESGPQGRERLQQLTGSVAETAESLRFSNQDSQDVQPLQKQILLLAAILFILDVAMRRIDFRSLKLREVKTVEAPVETTSSQLKRLKKKKHRIGTAAAVDLAQILDAAEKKSSDVPEVSVPEQTVEKSQGSSPQDSSDYMKRLKEAKRRK